MIALAKKIANGDVGSMQSLVAKKLAEFLQKLKEQRDKMKGVSMSKPEVRQYLKDALKKALRAGGVKGNLDGKTVKQLAEHLKSTRVPSEKLVDPVIAKVVELADALSSGDDEAATLVILVIKTQEKAQLARSTEKLKGKSLKKNLSVKERLIYIILLTLIQGGVVNSTSDAEVSGKDYKALCKMLVKARVDVSRLSNRLARAAVNAVNRKGISNSAALQLVAQYDAQLAREQEAVQQEVRDMSEK